MTIPRRLPLDSEITPDILERSAALIGIILYVAGSVSFIGIAISFFMFRLYALNSESRISFIILFVGLFCALQGLIFILVARGGELRRHTNYILGQISITQAHSDAPPSAPVITPPEE
jgi:hypothetical protein